MKTPRPTTRLSTLQRTPMLRGAMGKTIELSHQLRVCPECGQRYSADARFCPFDGLPLELGEWSPAEDKLVGQTIDSRYRVMAAIGEGGMGTVYKVRHATLERLFAMKVLRKDMAREDLAQRFTREAKAAASVHHPGVVEITDFGRLPDKRPYFVMELLEGSSLIAMLHGRKSIEPRLACAIAAKIARAVGAAHACGIVHRDLKPENIFVREPTLGAVEVKVVDFGAAMVIGASRITKTGIVYGTPHYMSPEQAAGQQLDHRADIYALGVLFFEMLIGNVPFEADTYMEVLRKHMIEKPPKPSSLVRGISHEVDKVVACALAKKVDDRYLTMESFASAIEKAALTLSSDGKSEIRTVPDAADSGTGPTTAAALAQLPIRSRSRTAVIGGAAAILGTLLVIVVAHANAKAPVAPVAPVAAAPTTQTTTATQNDHSQNAIDAVVAAPIKSALPDSSPIATSAVLPVRSSPRVREPAASVSASVSAPPPVQPAKQAARAGDFPDPWSK
jgi:serine/threonine-protein kinase